MTRLAITCALAFLFTIGTAHASGQDQGLAPFHAAQAAFDEAIVSFANMGQDHCYTNTGAAKLDIEELKSKFESYRMALLKVNRAALPEGAKKDLKKGLKAKQKVFAATKRSLRTKKRAAKLGGKRCFWTRNPTQPPTQPPTEPPTEQPTSLPTGQPTSLPTEQPTSLPTEQPTSLPTEQPTSLPTEPPTPPPTQPPTPPPTQPTHDGDFILSDCAANITVLQTFHYITGMLIINANNCTSIELNLLEGIGGQLFVGYNDQLGTFSANQLQTVGGNVWITENPQLGTFNVAKLQTIGGDLTVGGGPPPGGGNTQLSTFNADELQTIGGSMRILGNDQLSTFNVDKLQSIHERVNVRWNDQLTTFTADELQTVGHVFGVSDNKQLGTINTDKLHTIGNGQEAVGSMFVTNNPQLGTLGLAALTSPLKNLRIGQNKDALCSAALKSLCTSPGCSPTQSVAGICDSILLQ